MFMFMFLKRRILLRRWLAEQRKRDKELGSACDVMDVESGLCHICITGRGTVWKVIVDGGHSDFPLHAVTRYSLRDALVETARQITFRTKGQTDVRVLPTPPLHSDTTRKETR